MSHPSLEFFWWSPEYGDVRVERHTGQWRFSKRDSVNIDGKEFVLPDKAIIAVKLDGEYIFHMYLNGDLAVAITRAGLERYNPV